MGAKERREAVRLIAALIASNMNPTARIKPGSDSKEKLAEGLQIAIETIRKPKTRDSAGEAA